MGKTFVYTCKCICCNVVSGRLHRGVIVTLMNIYVASYGSIGLCWLQRNVILVCRIHIQGFLKTY